MNNVDKDAIKVKLLNKLAQNATYDKELDDWSIDFDKACSIVESVIDSFFN